MLATGLLVFLGIALILAKLPRRLMLRLLHTTWRWIWRCQSWY